MAQKGFLAMYGNYYAQNGRTPHRANWGGRKVNKKPACMTGKKNAGLLCPALCVMLPVMDNGGNVLI
jgi:hypothetical protein